MGQSVAGGGGVQEHQGGSQDPGQGVRQQFVTEWLWRMAGGRGGPGAQTGQVVETQGGQEQTSDY